MTEKKTTCDLCGKIQPEDYLQKKGWVYVSEYGSSGLKDFCSTCWAPVGKIMLRSFVDGLLMQACGASEASEDEVVQ